MDLRACLPALFAFGLTACGGDDSVPITPICAPSDRTSPLPQAGMTVVRDGRPISAFLAGLARTVQGPFVSVATDVTTEPTRFEATFEFGDTPRLRLQEVFTNPDFECPPLIEVPVSFTLQTYDGQFDERLSGVGIVFNDPRRDKSLLGVDARVAASRLGDQPFVPSEVAPFVEARFQAILREGAGDVLVSYMFENRDAVILRGVFEGRGILPQ